MNPQALVQNGLDQFVALLPVGYAFGAGMVSTVNPCGFAMLPAYLSLYLGTGEEAFFQQSALRRAGHAVLVASVLSLGFMVLFAVAGAIIVAGGRVITTAIPWGAVVVGAGLILLGGWMLSGGTLSFSIFQNFGNRIGDPRRKTLAGYFLFGMAFGASSLSCTLPVFMVVVGSALAVQADFTEGMLQFSAYSAGMALVILVLTLAMALFRQTLMIARLRRIIPHLHRISALLLLLAGAYILYYWLIEGGLTL